MSTAEPNQSFHTLTASSLWASLTVQDIVASVAWYSEVLGFEVDKRHEREGKLFAASMRAGAVRILLNQDNGAHGSVREKGAGCSLQISTSDDIDAIAAHIKSRGVTLDTEPVDTPWGARVFRVVDPDGFKFAISSEVARD